MRTLGGMQRERKFKICHELQFCSHLSSSHEFLNSSRWQWLMSLSSTEQKIERSGHEWKMEDFMQITWFFALRGWKCGKNCYFFLTKKKKEAKWGKSEKQKKNAHTIPQELRAFPPHIQLSSFFLWKVSCRDWVSEKPNQNKHFTCLSLKLYLIILVGQRSRVSECDIWRMRWGVLCAENRIQPEISEHIRQRMTLQKNKLAERSSRLLISKKEPARRRLLSYVDSNIID